MLRLAFYTWYANSSAFYRKLNTQYRIVSNVRPVTSLLITGESFSSDFGPFQGLKIEVSSGYLRETSIFKMIDDVNLWSKFESTW